MSESHEQQERTGHDFEKMARGLTAVGMSWARHGLTIGKSALETSAQTLRETAEVLGQLSEKFRAKETDGCCDCADPSRPAAGGQPHDTSSC